MPSATPSIRQPSAGPGRLTRCLLATVLAAGGGLGAAADKPDAASDPVAAEIGRLVAARQTKPSIHEDEAAIGRALAAAGLPAEAIARLFIAVGQTDLPGMGASLDSFLFLTRDPEWQSLRRHFAEYLELPGVTDLDAGRVRPLVGYGGVVTLPAVAAITPETAAALAEFGKDDWGAAVEFPAVKTLSPAAATALARCNALLVFPQLESLSAEAARALASHEGIGIVLGGLAALPADAAEALSENASIQGLLLPDLARLDSVALAKRLARQDHVFLPTIAAIDPTIAAALRDNEGGELALPGLRDIAPEVARQLVGAGYYWLRLGGAERLSPEAAAVLAGHNGQLTFTGTSCFSPAAATKLAAHANIISLPQVAELPADVIRALTPHEGGLILGGLTELPTETAAHLAMHAGGVHLPALERITPEAAAAFAEGPGLLSLPGLCRLTPAAAAALARRPGPLVLDALEYVERIDSAAHAELLVACFDNLELANLTALDGPDAAGIARVLAATKGTLALPALERITPRALEAILAKPGVALPEVAKLKLVPAPGGGVNDDVIMPER